MPHGFPDFRGTQFEDHFFKWVSSNVHQVPEISPRVSVFCTRERNRSAHGSPHFSPIPLVLLDNKPKRLIPALTLYLVNHLEG
ncbi:hypothetical protein TNCV_3767101 [Trichonephila clavipes]|nr:hypothetical protein TNCV_3767101 [Trichonephila clavipes]